ncbi:hypothetical protein GXB82_22250 [Pseudomonas stutzeri]|nr:hypothetical protein [Stutzerimonas stutzeri]
MYVRVILCVKLVYIQSARYVKRLKGALHSGRRAPAKRKKSNCIEFDGDTGIWGVGSGFEPTFGGALYENRQSFQRTGLGAREAAYSVAVDIPHRCGVARYWNDPYRRSNHD